MATIRTNRDLYLAIAELTAKHRESGRSLEEYLCALAALSLPYRERAALSPDEFFGLLSEAFTAPAPPFDEAWRLRCDDDQDDASGREGWEALLRCQVVDLLEMREQGTLESEYRYYGISSPRGHQWYNFAPHTFLECATVGTYGGWEPGEGPGRVLVPGPVAVLGEDGKLTTCEPEDVPNTEDTISEVTWDDFHEFLFDGQSYE